jgi:hypothetical protein
MLDSWERQRTASRAPAPVGTVGMCAPRGCATHEEDVMAIKHRVLAILATAGLATVGVVALTIGPAAAAPADTGGVTAAATATGPAAQSAAVATGDGVTVQAVHTVCAQTLLLRTAPGGSVIIGTLFRGQSVSYYYSTPGWSYVYSYPHSRYGWVQSGWLSPC